MVLTWCVPTERSLPYAWRPRTQPSAAVDAGLPVVYPCCRQGPRNPSGINPRWSRAHAAAASYHPPTSCRVHGITCAAVRETSSSRSQPPLHAVAGSSVGDSTFVRRAGLCTRVD